MGVAMARRKRRPTDPPPVAVDWGPDTQAQRAATVLEPRVHRGYQVRGKRRWHVLEVMHSRDYAPAMRISERQKDAGIELHRRWCSTELSPEWLGVFVDKTPDPSAAVAAQADKVRELEFLTRHIPHGCREVTMHVCCGGEHGLFISGKNGLTTDGKTAGMLSAQLKVALDILANHLGY